MDFLDQEEMNRRTQSRRSRQRRDAFWNFLTVCTVFATIALIALLMMVFSNPYISLNPFPPPTMPALVFYPTNTSTPVMLPPTWTPVALQPTETKTPQPTVITATSEPSATVTVKVLTTASDNNDDFTFSLQGAPVALNVDDLIPGTRCNWQGVAGQVVDIQGQPMVNYGILLKGTYNNKLINTTMLSGTHTEYGESGFGFQLGTTPVQSDGLLSVQMVDQAGLPMSDQVIFSTYGSCDKNLVLINFKQIR